MTDATELEEYRAAKDQFFIEDDASPIPQRERDTFKGLAYYPPNAELTYEVVPDVFDLPETVIMQTSDGEERAFQRWARVEFLVEGLPAALTIYRDLESDHLFLPFQDTTSGRESYGAGRYLEVPELEDGKYLLDFNYAYHPFCAYNPYYSCPIPPPENRLSVPIRAGERNP
jgi:uncharacterized protein (DUF1684 family)